MNQRKYFIQRIFNTLCLSVIASTTANAQVVTDYDSVPPLLAESATPMVMLAMPNDHQLFYKAYTDYDDLDKDGTVDFTYDNNLDYAGYFDSYKCYVYDTANNYFSPYSITSDKYCDALAGNQWSGNFLNWATMSRIDEVRKVLYGGKRVVDTAAQTVLQRAFLPNDAHSFAKYYNGTDLGKLTPFSKVPSGLAGVPATGITICNTTRHSGGDLSQDVKDPPLARIAMGNHSLWAANERWQCLYSDEKGASNGNNPAVTGLLASSSNPPKALQPTEAGGAKVGDYQVRVEACKSKALMGREDCKQYPSGNYKPIGILQRFGDDESVLFGLMTGSYKKNKSGGVLRKNISSVKDEINTSTDGTFKAAPATGGIVNTIDLFRIVNYDYADGLYNNADGCGFGLKTFVDGKCTNWGNPFAEILMECYRYFAGKSYDSNFDADDETLLSGLTRQTVWKNPQDSKTPCSNLNLIAFNASTASYDGDQLANMLDLNASQSAQALTKTVGDGEGITGKYFFVGENGGTSDAETNQLCTAKLIKDLGLAEGYCPTAPRLEGSFKMAGLAFHANTQDIRPDIDEKQTVSTYGVTLSPATPRVVVDVPGQSRKVTILPACRNEGVGGNCGLVDFKIVEQVNGTTESTGKFYVNWEDSEQGGDYDQDMSGILEYELTSTDLVIRTKVFSESTSHKLGFGFIVSGTTNDGFHSISGIESYTGYGCSGCQVSDAKAEKKFTVGDTVVGVSAIGILEQPLYYAAKWGGFADFDGDGLPSKVTEWDRINNLTGVAVPDGQPDNYFYATNPDQLKFQLNNILISILERTSAGTAAAVVTNTGTGVGAIYQALYNSRYKNHDGSDHVDWVGTLNGLFIDQYGNIREDNAAPAGQLTAADNVINVYFDPVSKKTKVQRYSLSADGSPGAPIGSPFDVLDLDPIWSAGDELAKVSDYVTQRPLYGNKANVGRYIFTSIDSDGDGQIGLSGINESHDFTANVFDPSNGTNNFRLLGLDTATQAEATSIVNWVRGENILGYRNRRIDVDGDGSVEPVLLGDIVHSSPVAVGSPNAGYDVAFGDDTYRTFRQKYQDRRQVVYTGANDGMLHAFNAGFFDATTSSHDLTKTVETEHPLGSELWAYIPYNVLPHLKWLKEADYPHVYYVDGHVSHHDVNIFADDLTHPGGWGTILVVGMRFGGGEYTLDPDSDADGNDADDITLRSSYTILDITDPEQPPKVIAELTHEDLGYTVAEPALVKMRAADPTTGSYGTPARNEWFLVFGSGPAGSTDAGRTAALNEGLSDKTAKIMVFNLKTKSLDVYDTGEANAFVGGVRAADWTRDYMDDAIYFGTVAGTIDEPKGKLLRGTMSGGSLGFSKVLDSTTQAFSATPLTVRDRLGDYWVYAGTGRYYVVKDNFSSKQQSFYGIKEPATQGYLDEKTVAKSDLINTTDIRVYEDGSVESKSSPGASISLDGISGPAETFNDVYNAVQANSGWYFDLTRVRSRNFNQAVISDQSLVFTEYQPSNLKCDPEGNGFLNAPHMHVGIPGSFAPLGTNPGRKNSEGAEEVLMDTSLGYGAPSEAAIHQRGDGKKAAIVQTSTGELSTTVIQAGISQGTRETWRELIIDWE